MTEANRTDRHDSSEAGRSGRPSSNQKGLGAGLSKSLPIVLAYVPVGWVFGVLARRAGLTVLETQLMSSVIYAGAAQFIAISMFSTGAGAGAMILTTFLVNLRHVLFSMSLAPRLKSLTPRELAVLAYGVTDETFVLNSVELDRGARDREFILGVNLGAFLAWNAGTLAGALAGGFIIDTGALGLEFALPALFISLLVFQLKDQASLVTAAAAGVFALGLAVWAPGAWNIIVAAVAAVFIGGCLESWRG